MRTVAPVAPGLLWGNVASSIAGALRTLAIHGTAPVETCHAVAERLLENGPLAGTGTVTINQGQLFFVRRSCCLHYQIPAGGKCGDCALINTDEPSRVTTSER
ncbi:(2Fe-2S)-binding protein [Actinoplanes sp. NPDC051346]|uniref:(2Fe-2S)-binding protein n=1 Tax=Actinoplanes sp. NPDC051346 TaxID=3155048 RepID=UPI003419E159